MDFLAEESKSPDNEDSSTINILIVDDDETVHESTTRAIDGFLIDGNKLCLLSSQNIQEANEIVENNDICIALLDISLEDNENALALVKTIKTKNTCTQIVVRTGQPGKFRADSISEQYDILNYITKENTDISTLKSVLINSHRQFQKEKKKEEAQQNMGKSDNLPYKLWHRWKNIQECEIESRSKDSNLLRKATRKFLLDTYERYEQLYKNWDIKELERDEFERHFRSCMHPAEYQLWGRYRRDNEKIKLVEEVALANFYGLNDEIKRRFEFKTLEIDEEARIVKLDGKEIEESFLDYKEIWKQGYDQLFPLTNYLRLKELIELKTSNFVFQLLSPDFSLKKSENLRISLAEPITYELKGKQYSAKEIVLSPIRDENTCQNKYSSSISTSTHPDLSFEAFSGLREMPGFTIHGSKSTVKSCPLPSKELSFELNDEKLETPVEFLRQVHHINGAFKKQIKISDGRILEASLEEPDFYKDQALHVIFLVWLAEGRVDKYGNLSPGFFFNGDSISEGRNWFQRLIKKII